MTASPHSGLPPACVHVDIDSWWAVRRCYDDAEAAPNDPDPIYEEALPALGGLLERLNVPASFFAIGQDAEIGSKAARLRDLAQLGPIENHTHSHPLALSDLSDDQFRAEIERAHQAIEAATSRAPRGFRAPGYDFDGRRLPDLLAELGYAYDSSILPTWAGPLLRLTDAWIRRGRPKRRQYGPMRRVFWGRSPQNLESSGAPKDGLQEFPVSVSSPWRLPLQAGICMIRGTGSLAATLRSLRRCNAPFIFLIHAIDALDTSGSRSPIPGGRGRRFFEFGSDEKLRALERMIEIIRETRVIVPIETLMADGSESRGGGAR